MDDRSNFDTISIEHFDRLLQQYPNTVPTKLADLERQRLIAIPEAVRSRQPPSLTKDELSTLMDWKLSHGKFRPMLKKLIQQNDSSHVEAVTAAHLTLPADADTKAVMTALGGLCKLKGVGPATASLLLSTADATWPFFSDELYRWATLTEPSATGKGKHSGWQREIKYTAREYEELLLRVKKFRERLSRESGRAVTALDVEKVAYVLGKQAATAVNAQESFKMAPTSQAAADHQIEDETSIKAPRSKRKATDPAPTEGVKTARPKRSKSKSTK